MAVMLQVAAPALTVTVQISGPYSPDVFDDGKRRVKELFEEVLAFQIAVDPSVQFIHEHLDGECGE